MTQVETYAEGLVTDVISEAQAEWLPTTTTVHTAGAQARSTHKPQATHSNSDYRGTCIVIFMQYSLSLLFYYIGEITKIV